MSGGVSLERLTYFQGCAQDLGEQAGMVAQVFQDAREGLGAHALAGLLDDRSLQPRQCFLMPPRCGAFVDRQDRCRLFVLHTVHIQQCQQQPAGIVHDAVQQLSTDDGPIASHQWWRRHCQRRARYRATSASGQSVAGSRTRFE
jgi:hypothetical protein